MRLRDFLLFLLRVRVFTRIARDDFFVLVYDSIARTLFPAHASVKTTRFVRALPVRAGR